MTTAKGFAWGTGVLTTRPPFRISSALLAALLPALLGLTHGLLICRPLMGFDPATGLLAWLNFTGGGTWNTIATPNPDNIAETIEIAVTWWPPGQYLFLGLLHSLGLSFGSAALLLAFISTISGSVGLATLARELGAPSKSLAWISASYACSSYSLINFHHFGGGEPLIMALWPWVALIGYRMRDNTTLSICVLPLLFLAGSFIKHSFAIYSICILAFLWVERLLKLGSTDRGKPLAALREGAVSSIPLVVSGVIYIILRHYTIDTSGSPQAGSTDYLYDIKEISSYVPNAPLLSVLELGSFSLRICSKLINIDPNRLLDQLSSITILIAPLSISLYLYLSFHRSPLLRFAGITAILSIAIYFVLHSIDYAISLDYRHYKQAGALLLAAVSAQVARQGKIALLARITVIACITWGTLSFLIRGHISPAHLAQNGLSISLDPTTHEELRSTLFGLEGNAILVIPRPDIGIDLLPLRPKSVRFMPIFNHGFYLADSYQGKVSEIVIAYPNSWEATEDELKARFQDYRKDQWQSYPVVDSTFLKVKSPTSIENASLCPLPEKSQLE